MNDPVEPLAHETLTRLSQAAQMSRYLIDYTGQLADTAVNWAKDMHWLQEPWMSAAAAQFGSGLRGRTQEVSNLQNEISRTLRLLEHKLGTLLDIAATCGGQAAGLLGSLGVELSERLPDRSPTVFTGAGHGPLSVDGIVAEMAEDVLDICVRLQNQGHALEAAMRRLPELRSA